MGKIILQKSILRDFSSEEKFLFNCYLKYQFFVSIDADELYMKNELLPKMEDHQEDERLESNTYSSEVARDMSSVEHYTTEYVSSKESKKEFNFDTNTILETPLRDPQSNQTNLRVDSSDNEMSGHTEESDEPMYNRKFKPTVPLAPSMIFHP